MDDTLQYNISLPGAKYYKLRNHKMLDQNTQKKNPQQKLKLIWFQSDLRLIWFFALFLGALHSIQITDF